MGQQTVTAQARVAPQALTVPYRYALSNVLLLAFLAGLIVGGWYIWLSVVVAALLAKVADEDDGIEPMRVSRAGQLFCDVNLYATLPLIAAITFVYLHYFAPHDPVGFIAWLSSMGIRFKAATAASETGPIIGATVGLGIFYAIAAMTVAHELIHRGDRPIAVIVGRALSSFTFNSSLLISHVQLHHRFVGTSKDPTTALRGDNVYAFTLRATIQGALTALKFEAARLRQRGLYPWSWRNRALRGPLYWICICAGAFALAGWKGLAGFVTAGLLGKLLHEAMSYTQHYGLVREEGAPFEPRHAWHCYHTLSSIMHYNLPRHADHHLVATTPFWRLEQAPVGPVLPYSYEMVALIALWPPLWRRIVHPLLADWDRLLASEGERKILAARAAA